MSVEINVFLLCYNEAPLLPHAIKHYKQYFPSCKITIYDNESTDNSVELAKSHGCNIVCWSSGDKIDDYKYKEIKNNCWKSIESGWIIMADMDEFLCITEADLMEEMKRGVTILRTTGKDMVGETTTLDLSDIDLQTIVKYVDNNYMSKNLCFLREKITEMNYDMGAHFCEPQGIVEYSQNFYVIKHMSNLGLKFIINKMIQRYKRSHDMRSENIAHHYTDDLDKIVTGYIKLFNESKIMPMTNGTITYESVINASKEI
jgi:glycosyltransferase involved in cell wall biosynthesis